MQAPIKVVDLGCGSGSLLIPLAQKFPQHHFIGYDWDKVPYFIAKFRSRKIPNIQLFNRNFMKENYSDVQLIVCYIGPSLKIPLGKKLYEELPEGAFVVSETFELDFLSLQEVIQANTLKIPTKVFLYQKKKSNIDSKAV
ncbi:MAG: class I SAM-dependent methyltransferase [Alphaproteobacteria bacterium]|nr:class I SAM-dependent methyltransferase [Alphaproteobacteria bacterium]